MAGAMDNANISTWVVACGIVAVLAAASMVIKPDIMPRLALHDPARRVPVELIPSTPSRVAETDLPLFEH
jgi:hypothetical protein